MSAIITFCLMLGLWLVMSGKFDFFHLGMGLLASALVTWLSHDLLFAGQPRKFGELLRFSWRFCGYAIWLLGEIVRANIHIAALALSPRAMDLEPRVITFQTVLKSDFARFVLANSITLTPGTVTIRIQDNTFYVHAITSQSAGDLAAGEGPGKMERWVAWALEGDKG